MTEKKMGVLVISVMILLFLSLSCAQENLTSNETIFNETLQNVTGNLTGNLTLNLTLNETPAPEPVNLTAINDTLSNLLENLINPLQNINNNGSYCYSNQDSIEYNKTVNGTIIPMTLNLSISVCYNETTLYCYSEQPSVSPILFRIEIDSYTCRSGNCDGMVISNPYDIFNKEFNESTSFICLGKIRQDGYFLWLWQATNLDRENIVYFDFSNSTFVSYEYEVTNTTIINITNNITNDIVNNLSSNFTYYQEIINNITANISGLETRIALVETWRIGVDQTLEYIIDIIYKISKFLERGVSYIDFSHSQFIANDYKITNETVYNITANITNNILNNETTNFTYIINITNNITAENLIELETRVSVLETWKEQVTQTLEYLIERINQILAKIKELI